AIINDHYQDAGVTWQLYQDTDNFHDNPLAWFKSFQEASSTSEMASRGLSYLGLDAFYEAASNGTLPVISFFVGPTELSEHPPYMPSEGAWLQKQIVDAVLNGPDYDTTALFISYDETGGFGDHVTPFHSGNVSPWTRGGRVFTERSDHNSQILFLEAWLETLGYGNVTADYMEPWRWEHMSNLVNAFDFSNLWDSLLRLTLARSFIAYIYYQPNFTVPVIPSVDDPVTDSSGSYTGTATCESTYQVQRPAIPYGNQIEASALYFEDGYKEVVGYLTEGRYLTLEKDGYALTNDGSSSTVSLTGSTLGHSSIYQRWVITYNDEEESQISYLPTAEVAITFLGNGAGYTMKYKSGSEYIDIREDALSFTATSAPSQVFSIYSVTYSD
ncbi:hypothetical protein N7504_003921, partial [Penicillium tannophilum]